VSIAAESLLPESAEETGNALLVVNLGTFDGPIDLLLHLAREQKVDLAKISMVKLAEQYLTFIEQAHELRLEIAADYLVMAAWLAYLKSRLLLPKHETEDEEPTGEELAAALAWQLRRLEAMQQAGARLLALPQLGVNTFANGQPQGLVSITHQKASAEIYDIMSAYAAIKKRTTKPAAMLFAPMELFSIEEAVERLRNALGVMPEWTSLQAFLPTSNLKGVVGRSALASTLIASLELAKQGLIEVRQEKNFGPIWLRQARSSTVADFSNDNEGAL
jgi:segregation and condensation protein A